MTVALLTTLLVPATGLAQIDFTEVALMAGLQFSQEAELNVPIGGGAVWADFDDDGWDDVFVAQAVGCNQLFLNDQNGGFVSQVDALGLSECDATSHGGGVADIDNDGDQDLYLTNNGQNSMFLNRLVEDGVLSFEDITTASGMDDLDDARKLKNSSSAVWGDYDEDGFVDLFVGQHFTTMAPLVCNPDLLWHNNGDGTFTELGDELGVAFSGELDTVGCALAATWSDYDNDGDVDLLVVNDFGTALAPNRLFRNDGPDAGPGGWKLTDVSQESGFDYPMFGMGIATGDLDRDGDLDYYMVDIGDNNLALNNGDGTFTDVAESAGVLANDADQYFGSGLVSWGPVFADADHDGWVDLFVANGGAPQDKYPDLFGIDYLDQNPNYCFRNDTNGRFTETHDMIGLDVVEYNRAFSSVDYDRDGDLDLYISNVEGPNALFENRLVAGPASHWIQIDVVGTLSNRDGLGARVTAEVGPGAQIREVDGGSSFLSASSRIVHFGVGDVSEVDRIWVQFLNGVVVENRHLEADRRYTVIEPTYLIDSSIEQAVLNPGEEILHDVTTVNRTDETISYDFWVEVLSPNGVQEVHRGPRRVELLPFETYVDHAIPIPVPEDAGPGEYEVILRVGDFATMRVEDQMFIDLTLVAE